MTHKRDLTLLDNNRKVLPFHRAEIEKVLPDHIVQANPNLIELFESYYEWMEKDSNPNGILNKIYSTRDATSIPGDQLPFLEDELLLGEAYFGGFINKREAVKFSNFLYRSKGTKYSIEQFFRGFFGVDPAVIYPKNNVFRVGPAIDFEKDSINTKGQQIKDPASQLGPESLKYITNDKLYQTLSILIRSTVPVGKWLDTYKLFVHPAGFFIGSELVIEAFNVNPIPVLQDDVGEKPEEFISIQVVAAFDIRADKDITLLNPGDAVFTVQRQDVDTFMRVASDAPIGSIDNYTMAELLSPNSLTMDDSDVIQVVTFDEDSSSALPKTYTSTFDKGIYDTQYDSAN